MRFACPAWMGLLCLGALSCQRRQPYYPPEDTAAVVDTSPPLETGGVVDHGEEVVCADPSLRETLGAFERIELDVSLESYEVLPDMTLASGVSVGDLTGDGLLDIVVPQAGPSQLLVQQADGRFVDETDARWSGSEHLLGAASVTIVDVNGDGLLAPRGGLRSSPMGRAVHRQHWDRLRSTPAESAPIYLELLGRSKSDRKPIS